MIFDRGAGFGTDGFFGEVEVEETAGGGGEEGRVSGCSSRGDYGDAVGGSAEVGGEIETGPARADDQNVRLGHFGGTGSSSGGGWNGKDECRSRQGAAWGIFDFKHFRLSSGVSKS